MNRAALCGVLLALGSALCSAGCAHSSVPDVSMELRAHPQKLVSAVAALRGLPDSKPTRIVFDDDKTFAAALDTKAEKDGIGPTPEDTVGFYLAFDPPSPSPGKEKRASTPEEVINEQIIAFYDKWTHTVHVRDSALKKQPEDELVGVIAHEIAHSLQEQHLPFPNLADIHENDARLAHNAVLEGDAMLVMVAHLAERHRIPPTRALANAAAAIADREFERYARASGADQALMRAPPLLREQVVFPYMSGLTFIGAMYRAGGFELVNKVFGHPPTTTEQVLHPEKYLAGEEAIPVAPPEPPPGNTTVATGRVGELQMRVALGQCMPQARAAAAAAGWGGDAYLIAHNDDSGLLLWSTVWDDADQAIEFESALQTWTQCTRQHAGSHVFPLDDVVRRDGTKVSLVRGIAGKPATKLAESLLKLPAKPPAATAPFGPITIPALRQARAFRPPYVNGNVYVNEQLGLVATAPPGFHVAMPDSTTAIFSREASSAAVAGLALSDQVASTATIDELHGAVAAHVQKLLGNHDLEYVGGRDVYLPALGRGIERVWTVKGTNAGLRALVLPICQGTGSFLIWQLWVDENGAAALRWWVSTLRPTVWAEPPICAELNP